ncbi:MAG: hypothetical protein H6709_23340 [Kofleriaceae bacterium]|nr:hypothetical protein [Kofleriaceae bacterium]MCB9575020.1 hypothetical protein [Kofleriaceae bacterium]
MRSDMKEDPTANYVVKILDLRGQHLSQPDLCRWLPDGWEVVANHCVSMVFLPRLPTTPWPPGPVLDFDHAVDEDGAARIMFAKNNVIIAPTDGAARVEEIVGTAEDSWARQTVFWLEPARYGRIDRELRALQSRAPQRLRVEDLPHGELKAFLKHDLQDAGALDDYDRRMLCMPRR